MEVYDETYEEWLDEDQQRRMSVPVCAAVWMAVLAGSWLLAGAGLLALGRLLSR